MSRFKLLKWQDKGVYQPPMHIYRFFSNRRITLEWKGVIPAVLCLLLTGSLLPAEPSNTDRNSQIIGDIRLDPRNASLSANLSIKYLHKLTPANALTFYLDNNLDLKEVRGPGILGFKIAESNINPYWHEVSIELSNEILQDDSLWIHMSYEGQLKTNATPFTYPKITEEWIELPGNIAWMPLFETFVHPFVYDLSVYLPTGYEIVSNGATSNTKNGYRILGTTPIFSVTLWGAKSYFQYKNERIVLFSYNESNAYPTLLNDCAEGMTFLSNLLGTENALNQIKILISDRDISGYSLNNMVALHRIDSGTHHKLMAFLVHEFSHNWWREANYFSYDHWLNESFAEYTGMLFVREKFGMTPFLELLDIKLQNSLELPSIFEVDFNHDQFHDVIYNKGCIVLFELEDMIGFGAFEKLLKDRITLKINSTERLLQYVRNSHGKEIALRFEYLLKN